MIWPTTPLISLESPYRVGAVNNPNLQAPNKFCCSEDLEAFCLTKKVKEKSSNSKEFKKFFTQKF